MTDSSYFYAESLPCGDPNYDKLHKVRPLVNMARESIAREYSPH